MWKIYTVVVAPILMLVSYRYPYISLAISSICALCYFYAHPILWTCMILTWLRDSVDDPEYTRIINKYLAFLDDPYDEIQAKEILMESVGYAVGISTMPRIKHIGDPITCPVSLEDIRSGDDVMVLPCGHKGRYDTMKQWIVKHHTCPVCRNDT